MVVGSFIFVILVALHASVRQVVSKCTRLYQNTFVARHTHRTDAAHLFVAVLYFVHVDLRIDDNNNADAGQR